MPKLDITQSFVDTVKVESEASSTDFYDKKLVGLLLKVLPSGRKTFYLRYKDTENCSCQRKIGNAVILNITEARDLARRYLAQISLGQDPLFTCVDKQFTHPRIVCTRRLFALCENL